MTTRARGWLAVATILLSSSLVERLPAQAARLVRSTSPSDSADRFIAREMERKHIPGVAIAVLKGGRVIKATGYGMADLEHGIPVTPQTVFKIGSVSKQFIATGIMLLAQDGRLAVDDTVTRYLREAPPTWRGVTLRQLLSHTSGIVREGPAFNPTRVQPDSVVVASAFSESFLFTPGERYEYCNVCYFALADIIRRVSTQPWDQFLSARVFAPLGMTDTRPTTTSTLIPRRARGYIWKDAQFTNADDYVAVRPSGAFLSTVMDLAKWDAALYTDTPLTSATRAAMWSPVRLNSGARHPYGFGWLVDSLDGHLRVHHGGALPGFRAEWARFPDDSLSIIVLTNADAAIPAETATGLARLFLGPPPRRARSAP